MKDSYYFQHDCNARNDPKIKALIKEFGLEGYGKFWVIIEMLRESAGYKLEDEVYVWEAIAEYTKTNSVEARNFVNACINKFKLLAANEDGSIYSPALLERMIKLDGIRMKRKLSAEARWEKED